MVSFANAFWEDEAGFLISSELVIIATLLVVGLVVGLSAVQAAVMGELRDVGSAIGNLNQSYGMTGFKSYHRDGSVKAFTVGSGFWDGRDQSDRNRNDFAHPRGQREHGPRRGPHRPPHHRGDRGSESKPGEPRREPIDEARPLPKPIEKSSDKKQPAVQATKPGHPHGHRPGMHPHPPRKGHPHHRGMPGVLPRANSGLDTTRGPIFIPGVGWLGCNKSPRSRCFNPAIPSGMPYRQHGPSIQHGAVPADVVPIESPLPVYPPQPEVITIPISEAPTVPVQYSPSSVVPVVPATRGCDRCEQPVAPQVPSATGNGGVTVY